uniref:Membrane-associated protein n=1 Tax=Macrostomum lignano TaxID=282301 RepID=A0A1I8F886_9PLAT
HGCRGNLSTARTLKLTAYARLVPPAGCSEVTLCIGLLLLLLAVYGLLAADAVRQHQHVLGILVAAFFFIPAGATGLAGGRGRANTLCCIVSCLVAQHPGRLCWILSDFGQRPDGFGIGVSAVTAISTGVCASCRPTSSGSCCFLLELVVAIVHAAFSNCRASCPGCVDKKPSRPIKLLSRKAKSRPAPLAAPAMSQSSDFTSSVRQLPHRLLRAHVIMGAIQITVGCLQLEDLLGFWTFPVFIAAGATGLAGGRGRSNTRCCLIGCLVLSSLAAIVSAGAIAVNIFMCFHQFGFASYADILWLLAYLLETVVAIVQVVFASRTVCCRFRLPTVAMVAAAPGGAAGRLGRRPAYATKTGNSYM